MYKWLKSIKSLTNSKSIFQDEVLVVLGNEACDLDSGVSAIALAFHYHIKQPNNIILPVLNIVSKDYALKTELVHALEEQHISQEDLVFRDSISLKSLDNLKLALVDHNMMSGEDSELENRVGEVIDHHVMERAADTNARMLVEPVGSCSTLVAQKILSESPELEDKMCLSLLLDTILVDTVALDPQAKKVTAKDIEMVEKIESIIGAVDRTARFNQLWAAKAKIDHFTAHQLLRRDLKCIQLSKAKIGLSSVPLLVEDFLKMKTVCDDLNTFMEEEHLDLVLVLGYSISQGNVQRDLLVCCPNSEETQDDGKRSLYTAVSATLLCDDNGLQLTASKMEAHIPHGEYFQQGNSSASRKRILPLVKSAAKEFCS